MEERAEHPGPAGAPTEEERAEARERFRRKLAEAEAQMTPERRTRLRAELGLDSPVDE
jgi:hypothetical protein